MFREPFRGSRAVAEGLVTSKQLRGPRFARLYPDIYIAADVEIDFKILSQVAFLLVKGSGVLCGFSAAELLGASCGPAEGPRHHRQVDPWEVVRFSYGHPGVRGRAGLPEAARLADRRAESPMETQLRLIIGFAGLPPPAVQHPVGSYRLDLAYPQLLLGIEYDGREHLTTERARRDLARENAIGRAGWEVVRFRAAEILGEPERVAADIRAKIASVVT